MLISDIKVTSGLNQILRLYFLKYFTHNLNFEFNSGLAFWVNDERIALSKPHNF